jgi:soluble lytic murein transglycosylase-like protein
VSFAIAGMAGIVAFGWGSAAPAKAERTAPVRELICRMVDAAAETYRLPSSFLTRVLWQKSGFHTDVTSPAGAAGVAQFMPGTAAERGLADPYDPDPAIRQSARLLAELATRCGNLGLATAAYNAGPAWVWKWLHAQSGLPTETQLYVLTVTGRRVEEWRVIAGEVPAGAACGL